MEPNRKVLNFELEDVEADVILKGLSELPYREASPIISKMFAQANKQLQPAPQKESTDKPTGPELLKEEGASK